MAAFTTTLPIVTSYMDITLTLNENAKDQSLLVNHNDPVYALQQLTSLFQAGTSGDLNMKASVSTQATFATNVFTIVAGNLSADDTVTIGGITFTAKASGATGAQFNIGATAAATAVNLANLINTWTNTTSNNGTVGMVTAVAGTVSTSGTVTVTAQNPGSIGNAIVTTKSATNGSWTTGTLTGGTSPAVNVYAVGY